MQIYSTLNLKVNPAISLYGPGGSQKTFGIRTAPNPIVLSTDMGESVLKKYDVKYSIGRTFKEVLEFVKFCQTQKQFQTIVIDDMTEIAHMHMREANDLSLKVKGKKANGESLYGDSAVACLNIIRDLRVLPNVFVVLIFKQVAFRDSKGLMSVTPQLPGNKVLSDIPHMTSELWHAEIHPMTCQCQGQQLQTPCPQCNGAGVVQAPFFRTQRIEGQVEAKTRSGLPPLVYADWSAVFQQMSN